MRIKSRDQYVINDVTYAVMHALSVEQILAHLVEDSVKDALKTEFSNVVIKQLILLCGKYSAQSPKANIIATRPLNT